MRVVDKYAKVPRYVVGMGMMFTDRSGNRYLSSKATDAINRVGGRALATGKAMMSNVERQIENEIAKGPGDLKPLKENVVKAVKQSGLRELVHKGKPIPNAEKVIENIAPMVPLKATATKVSKTVKAPLSDLLTKKAKKGNGLYLHGTTNKGQGLFLHGSGFAVA